MWVVGPVAVRGSGPQPTTYSPQPVLVRKIPSAAHYSGMRLSLFFLIAAGAAFAQDACQPQAPCYTAAGIVNSASFLPAIAPQTFISIFGTNLAWAERARTQEDPLWNLGGVKVIVSTDPDNPDNGFVGIVSYASPTQVNVLLPDRIFPAGQGGEATIELLRDSVAGPAVKVNFAPYAPALFQLDKSTAVAVRWPAWRVATREEPSRPGEIVVLYATGLGPLFFPLRIDELPTTALELRDRRAFRILLDGAPVEDRHILYAGCAPLFYGLYQINLWLPEGIGADPEIRIAMGDYLSPAGIRITVATE